MHGNQKGSKFERDICRKLSLWWSQVLKGKPRDDIFWRSSQSGGRATFRAQKGKRTSGSYGDIAAIHPKGNRLIRLFTIELKRGKSHGEPGDLLDCKASPKCHKWIATMEQAIGSAVLANSHSWLIIVQRDFRNTAIFFPWSVMREGQPLFHARRRLWKAPAFRYRLLLPKWGTMDFVGVSFDRFLASVKPNELVAFG